MTPSFAPWKYELEWERRVEEARARAAAARDHGIGERIFLDRLAQRLAEPDTQRAVTHASRKSRPTSPQHCARLS